jgi:hypothetical protein
MHTGLLVAQLDGIMLHGRTRYAWEDNIKMDHTKCRMGGHELESFRSGYGPVASFCKYT